MNNRLSYLRYQILCHITMPGLFIKRKFRRIFSLTRKTTAREAFAEAFHIRGLMLRLYMAVRYNIGVLLQRDPDDSRQSH